MTATGAAPILSDDDFFASLPTRRAVAVVVLTDTTGRICLVKPTYRDGWLLPGGTVVAGESPWAAAHRELREELGLDLDIGTLVVIEHQRAAAPVTEALHFVFRGTVLDDRQIAAITLPADELSDVCFVDLSVAIELSAAPQRNRLAVAATHTGPTPLLLG